jgi:hypothetical protein
MRPSAITRHRSAARCSYFTMAFVPMFIVYATLVVDPSVAATFEAEDAREVQRILPDLIL